MAIPHNKEELLAAINTNFEKLFKELQAIPADKACDTTMEGHVKDTYMSVSNLVAYLVGWNTLVMSWMTKKDAGEAVDFPETGFKWNELGRLAHKFYKDYEDVPYPELLKQLCAGKAEITAAVQARSNAVLYEQPWYDKWPMGRMIQFNTSSPYDNARGRVRKWIKIQGMMSVP